MDSPQHENPEKWIAGPCGHGVLDEYLPCVQAICILPEFMAASALQRRLSYLTTLPQHSTDASGALVIAELIMKAFLLPNAQASRSFFGSVDALDVSGNLFSECLCYVTTLTWERPFVLCALHELVCKDYAMDTLKISIGFMARAANECLARKRASFSVIINMIEIPSAKEDGVPDHIFRLRRLCAEVIDDIKDEAFKRAFVNPTELYCAVARSSATETDLDVHGASTYLALLLASTGIRLRRLPTLLDESTKGVADALEAGLVAEVAALWAPENRFTHPAALRLARGQQCSYVRDFIWPSTLGWADLDTVTFASNAIDPSPGNCNRRARLGLYLHQFCSFFTEDVILPRLLTALTSDTPATDSVGAGAAAGDLARVFADLQRAGVAPNDRESAQEWLWDIASDPATFNAAAARVLFAAIGIAKAADWQPASPDTCTAHPKHAPVAGESFGVPAGRVVPAARLQLTAAGDVRGGGTGREFLENLLSEGTQSWNKWLHLYATQSWVHIRISSGPAAICGYGMCSANDCPERDPIAWTLLGRGPGSAWSELHRVEDAAFVDRWQWLWFALAPATVSELRLVIRRVRWPGDGVQLGHLRLLEV